MPYIADETTATFVEPKNVEQMEEVVLKTKKRKIAATTSKAARASASNFLVFISFLLFSNFSLGL